MLPKSFLEASRGRIVELLRRGCDTVERIASELGVTPNAVRAQLAAMERDGLVQRAGTRPGATRPFQVFQPTAGVELLLSRAYIPLLAHLLRLVAASEPRERLERLMRRVGKALAADLARHGIDGRPFEVRLAAVATVLNDELGAVTEVKRRNGQFVILGHGCPLAALTENHPAVCLAVETLVSELLGGTVVRECCVRTGRPKCCFEVESSTRRRNRNKTRHR